LADSKVSVVAILIPLLLLPLAALHAADAPSRGGDTGQRGRTLVGVNYFAGCWESLLNNRIIR
jgi:hypothetical protein